MKISGFEPIKQTGKAEKRGSTSSVSGGGFAALLGLSDAQEAAPVSHAGDVAATAALNNLLALQEISEEEVKRKKLLQQGKNTLDALEALRQQLLIGSLPMQVLRDISRNIAIEKQVVTDPHLMALMADIELRAAVELAKLEVAIERKDRGDIR
jgi:hypothetical protein